MSADHAQPARSIASMPGSMLPSPVTPLIGRDTDLARVRRLLDAGETRLLTLTGPGGIGKTRLALGVAAAMEPDFAHGACFVGLASVRDPALIPAAVARALGLQEPGDRPAAELVMTALRDRHLLLVLDNLEHLVDEAALWTSELLDGCSRLTVLATSRIALQVTGEQRFPVPPLALPDTHTANAPERLQPSAAVELFVRRARAVHPDFALTPDNAETLREICLALDGLPLAIELAAARTGVLSPAALLARLTDRLTILQGTTRDVPSRHRTMRDTIAWSHDLLSPAQQALFRALSVFTGGFSLEAAESVGGDQALNRLTDLVDHSLVQRETTESGASRFHMHEVIREYGLEQLEAAGEAGAVRDAHAEWCLELALRLETGWERGAQIEWLDRLAAEHSNLRTALSWLVENDRFEDAQDLAGSLWLYFIIRGMFAEGRRLYEELVAHPHGGAGTIGRAKALIGLGLILAHQGVADRAIPVLEEALALCDAHGDRRRLAAAQGCLALALLTFGRLDESETLRLEALALAREVDYPLVIASELGNLGLYAMLHGDMDEARRLVQQSVDLARATGNTWIQAIGIENLGNLELRAGRLDAAERLIREANDLLRRLGSKRDLPIGLMDLADIAGRKGDLDTARHRLDEAQAMTEDTGDAWTGAIVLQARAALERSAGRIDVAVLAVRRALNLWVGFGNVPAYADCLDILADIAIEAGDMPSAARMIGAADGLRDRSHQQRVEQAPDEHEHRLATIRGALGDGGFQVAWEAGRELETEAMIFGALAWAPPAATGPIESAGARVPLAPAMGLSPREVEVLKLMADGLTNQQIADRLFLSRRTATSHASNILAKLDLPSRTAAVAWALRNGVA